MGTMGFYNRLQVQKWDFFNFSNFYLSKNSLSLKRIMINISSVKWIFMMLGQIKFIFYWKKFKKFYNCVAVTCERLRAPLHGKVNCTKGNTIDSKCTYSCNSDYYLSSSQTAKCVANNLSSIGKWDNHNLPTCKREFII